MSSHATEEREGKRDRERDKEEDGEGEKKEEGAGERKWILHLGKNTAENFFHTKFISWKVYTITAEKA